MHERISERMTSLHTAANGKVGEIDQLACCQDVCQAIIITPHLVAVAGGKMLAGAGQGRTEGFLG